MLKEQRNPKKQGDVGHGVAISYFMTNGYTVSVPLSESETYDLVVDIDNRLCKIQIKTTCYRRKQSNNFLVVLKTSGWATSKKNYYVKKFVPSNVDYLFVLTENNDKYLIPTSVMTQTTTLELTERWEQYKI